jgi:FtsX-like permease family/Peptidase family M28
MHPLPLIPSAASPRPVKKIGQALRIGLVFLLWWTITAPSSRASDMTVEYVQRFKETTEILASFGDRSTGTPGARAAAAYIQSRFSQLGVTQVSSHRFAVPVRLNRQSSLYIGNQKQGHPINPMIGNAVSPEATSPEGVEGPLVYVGSGGLRDINGKDISGAILLMEMDSGNNWLQCASLGAKALVYVDRGRSAKTLFNDKLELTPVHFPRFWMTADRATALFGSFEQAENGRIFSGVRLVADIRWENVVAENIYGLIPGTDKKLSDECIVVEAFYDSSAFIPGLSPGADEACGISTLIELGRYLKKNPPGRSVILVATVGHAQTLAGMRELIWSIRSRSKEFRDLKKQLKRIEEARQDMVDTLRRVSENHATLDTFDDSLRSAVTDQIKTEVDRISKELMRLRLEDPAETDPAVIDRLAQKRLMLRRLSWRASEEPLSPEEAAEIRRLMPLSEEEHHAVINDAHRQRELLRSASNFRRFVKELSVTAVVSLHLSSHGDGFGAFGQGWLYSLKPTINRVPVYTRLDEILRQGAKNVEESYGVSSIFRDTLRPNRQRTWQSYLIDQPALGGEVSALAGYLGVSLATVNDARSLWGTPSDLPENVDWDFAVKQSNIIAGLIAHLSDEPRLHDDTLPRIGFSTVTGRAKFLRHGELFPDQPAPGSVILAYQGLQRYHLMVDTMGMFYLKGVADKKNVWDKIILEGYRFDPDTGSIVWAVDKEQTGKSAYRVKMQRLNMETDLVMFSCRGTILFNTLEPRNFRYMTKIQLFDGRLEAPPVRYWWSRIDSRISKALLICLEPTIRLKLTLSDTMLKKKMLLTNATADRPEGTGYRIDEWPAIHRTEFRVANDMWQLLTPRIANLERHGIYSDRIRRLYREGTGALDEAGRALTEKAYGRFFENTRKSWALASRVYDHVEKTQRDVLFGVLFYIALFVPFAFCMERLIFSYASIYKRIIAFIAILIALIAIIYKVHPAFQLAYSPMVVILAFFIMGLSLMVTLIIFLRFEEEMILLQQRGKRFRFEERSRWKAFAAAFFLGVSNLRRRRLRTFFTCSTLVILTFTIMSFTAVKSMRHHARILYQPSAPYQGFLFKNVNWWSLPSEALDIISNTFSKETVVSPRVWLEDKDRTRPMVIPVHRDGNTFEAGGMIGLSPAEAELSNVGDILIGGRWFAESDRYSVIIPDRLAKTLGIDPVRPRNARIFIWGMPFEVVGVFSGEEFRQRLELDGEPLTPVTFPHEISLEMTEVEMDAFESGEDVQAFQSRYQHVPADITVIVPYQTLLSFGGQLKSVAVRRTSGTETQDHARYLVDRFGLTLFSGEKEGTYIYKASDTLSYSGVPNILIPMVISVFIVLNTMIGSVYERKREIGIYTSVGLAPSHVSFLFIAEAMAFGVISVVLGYLLAQTSAKLFSGTAVWAGITVNYSSLAGVAAMALVIAVVLISVIYPSRVAAEIAIPDVKRSWKLPESQGNLLEIPLPFLLKYDEQPSVAGYLFDYFRAHQEVTHALFSTGGLGFDYSCPFISQTGAKPPECEPNTCCRESCIRIYAKVWLAPFDFGIMQHVEVNFCHSTQDPGFYEIAVRLERESGESNAWRRINKGFLYVLRKQLLMWRSFDDKTKDDYAEVLKESLPPQPNAVCITEGTSPQTTVD